MDAWETCKEILNQIHEKLLANGKNTTLLRRTQRHRTAFTASVRGLAGPKAFMSACCGWIG